MKENTITKEHQVIMLSTDKASYFGFLTKIGKERNDLRYYGRDIVNILDSENQHLYFISNEPVKERDWYINLVEDEHLPFQLHAGDISSVNDKKIIATTNSDLWYDKMDMKTWENTFSNAHKIDTAFIEVYVKEQGKIKSVLLEYQSEYYDNNGVAFGENYIKLKANGSVVVHPVKEKMYNREEVIKMFLQFAIDCDSNEELICYDGEIEGIRQYNNLNKWIEQHL